MGLLSLVLVLAIVGVALYLIETLLPMDPAIKTVIRVVVIVVVLLWLVQIFVGDVALPRLHR